MKIFIYLFFILISFNSLAQKDVLDLGDSYADDQLYLSFSYAQFFNQPSVISKSGFSYGLSAGFLKDFILNKEGSFAFAFGTILSTICRPCDSNSQIWVFHKRKSHTHRKSNSILSFPMTTKGHR